MVSTRLESRIAACPPVTLSLSPGRSPTSGITRRNAGIGEPMASLISLLSIATATHARGDRPMAQKKPTVYEFIPKLGQLRDDVLFGDVWEHPDLSKRDRSL